MLLQVGVSHAELRRENSQLKEDKVALLTQLKEAYASVEHKDEEMCHMMVDYREHMAEADATILRVCTLDSMNDE